MFIAISEAEKMEKKQDQGIAKAIISLRQALNSNDAQTIANALHKWELPHRTEGRFKYAIEWEILGTDKVALWENIKTLYYAKKELI